MSLPKAPPLGSSPRGLSKWNSSENSGHNLRNKRRKLEADFIPLKEVYVKVDKLRMKEILITTPSKGTREVYYKDEWLLPSQKNYEDWRIEQIPSFKSRKRKRRVGHHSNSQETSHTFRIPRDFDSIFVVEWADGDVHAILNLLGGGPMELDVVDAYFLSRLQRYREMGSRRLQNVQYLSVQFTMVESRDQDPSTIQSNPFWAPELTPEELQDCILLAPQYISKHLYLAVFNFPRRTVSAYDSSWHYLPMPLRSGQIQAILQALSPKDCDKWKVTFKTKSSPQYDEYSCGSYTIFYGDNLLKWGEGQKADRANAKKLSNERVTSIRKGIAKELLKTTIQGRKFLEAITD